MKKKKSIPKTRKLTPASQHINKTEAAPRWPLQSQLVRWPWQRLITMPQFSYNDAGRAQEQDWKHKNKQHLIDTHEGGLEVWLLVPEDWSRRNCCTGSVCEFILGEAISPGTPQHMRRRRRSSYETVVRGYPCLAAVLLGSVRVSFAAVNGKYWIPQVYDLTPAGKQLYQMLWNIWDIEPVLHVELDT